MAAATILPLQDLELALELQRQELDKLKKSRKGKGREGAPDDFSLAIQLYEAEIATCTVAASDEAICRSIAKAVNQDADLIGAILREEGQATQDREFALSLSRGRGTSTEHARRPTVLPVPDGRLLATLEALNMSSDQHPAAESSTWAASRPGPSTSGSEQQQPKIECVACTGEHLQSDVYHGPCSHDYCRDCLASLFTACLTDESLFPPRCCGQAIPHDSARAYLSPQLAGEFLAKKTELETPNRTYCHQPTCSAFIPPQFIKDGEVGTCLRCEKTTCVTCKGQSHEGDCPHDETTQELLRVAAENGWQRCFACRRVVELKVGCNHMTCFCGAQFCYACSERWKTCRCEQWIEERLLDRADVIVDRDVGARQIGTAERAIRREHAREYLRRNHECNHTTWRSQRGPDECEVCHQELPFYLFECVQCRIMACRRCRFNRL